MSSRLCGLGTITVAILAFACGRMPGGEPPPSVSSATAYHIVGAIESAPAECSAEIVSRRVADLFAAVSAGSPGIADRFFSSEADGLFQWFSFTDAVPGGTGHFTAIAADQPARGGSDNARVDLDPYFAGLKALGDAYILRGIKVVGWDPVTEVISLAPIFFEYHRRVPETSQPMVYYGRGKAAYHCPTASFMAMSLTSVDEKEWHRFFSTYFPTTRSTE